MRNFLIILSVFWLWTCSGGGDNTTGPEEPPIVINLTSLGGQAQKGPFNNGTAINVAELTNTLSPTGRNFSSAITDNTGRFAVANVQLESPYVELRANGYYFNEVTNEISSGQLTLFALSNLTGKTSLNVNILTHLEKNRMVTLMSGDNPKTFAQAKLQAQEEVLAIFDYSRANVPESELLDISQGGAANAKLLAISAIIQGDLSTGQMSELLANISTDISSDGTLDNTNLIDTLISNSQGLDMSQVRSNLEARYSSLGISATIPDFESEILQFLKPPVANDMSASTDEDTAINITLDATDPEGEFLTYTILEVNNATITLSENGDVATYIPNAHFNGTDTFTYYANDGTSDSNIATVTVTINAIDDEPNTIDVATTTDEDVAVVVALSAEEYDGDGYSFSIISQPSNGSVSLDGTNATYTPNQDFNGEDTFTFEATDNSGRTINVATATITVNAVNDAPIANDITNQTTDENRMMQLDITLDATDVDGDALTYNVTSTNNGSVTINDNIATYVPNQDWNGEDSFTYVANDGSVDSNTATVAITVNSINDAPVTQNVSFSTNEDTAYTESYTAYVNDVEGDDLTIIAVTEPTNGTASCDDDKNCTYTPNQDFNGTDSFTYKVNDGELDSNISTVTVTVNPLNDPPFVPNDIITASTNEDETVQITLSGIDVDSNVLTYTLNDQGFVGNGTLTIDNDSEPLNEAICMYTPNPNWHGTETVGMFIQDENSRNSFELIITVNPVNDAPTVQDTTGIEVLENRTKQIVLVGTDIEGSTLSYSVVDEPSLGTVTLQQDTATYTASSLGSDSFTFKATDSDGLDSNIGTVSLTVVEDTSKTFSTGRWAWASDIIETTDGGFLLAGVDKQIGSGDRGDDQYLVKTNSFGDEEWSRTLADGQIYSVIETDDGNFAFTGGNPDEAFISKVDASGNQIWLTEYTNQSYNYDTFRSIKQSTDGGYIVAGASTEGSDTYKKGYVVKLDSQGNEEWSNYYGFSANPESFIDVELTSEGGYILGGYTSSVGNGSGDFYLVKIDSSGNEEWYKTFGGSDADSMLDLVVLPDGGFAMLGTSNSFNIQDAFLVKTDSSGNLEWFDTFVKGEEQNIQRSSGESITISQDGNIVITGYVLYVSGSSSTDTHLTKIDLNGNQLWSKIYGGDRGDHMFSVVSTTDGGFALGGRTTSFGEVRQGGSAYNMWLIKTSSDGTQEF